MIFDLMQKTDKMILSSEAGEEEKKTLKTRGVVVGQEMRRTERTWQ